MPQEYKENDIVDIPGGRSFQLRAGKWEPYSDEHQLAGAAKAVGSGLLHEAIPSTVGAGGDVMQLPKELGIWTGKKLRGLFGGGEQSSDTRSAQEKELEGEGATSVKTALPNSEQVRSVISGVVPEYEPQNFVERGLKTAAGIAPAALASPEAAGARMLPAAGRSLARYAAAPGFASEGVSEIPLVKGSKLEEPLKIMAQILASHGMTRAIIAPHRPPSVHLSQLASDCCAYLAAAGRAKNTTELYRSTYAQLIGYATVTLKKWS